MYRLIKYNYSYLKLKGVWRRRSCYAHIKYHAESRKIYNSKLRSFNSINKQKKELNRINCIY